MIFQQFGRKETKSLCVGLSSDSGWDDCLARFSMEDGTVASVVVTGGTRIAILATERKTSFINIYNSVAFERLRQTSHPERATSIHINHQGSLIVSYGYLTTRVWNTATGSCIKTLENPQRRPRPHSIQFVEDDQTVLVAGEDRCIRSFSLAQEDDTRWQNRARIEEQSLGSNTVLNFPMCSALSHDGTMIAFGYRSYPLTVWELEPTMLVGQCNLELDAVTAQGNTSGEVFRVAWHPFSDEREVFGLTQVGLLFKWNPYEDSPSAAVQTGAHNLNVSTDGSLVATGDAIGTVKVFASADLSLLYQLSSQDPVTSISFSADSRRLYDVRGSYGNVWQPNTLARLAEGSNLLDHMSDSMSEADSMSKFSLQPEHQSIRVDNVITISGQSVGPLYCYGTEDGVAVLGQVGHGKACEIERLESFMSIEQVAWSEDGSHVAMMDVSGKLLIKKVTRVGHGPNGFRVDLVFDLQLPPDHGHITQLFFHATRKELFASAPNTLFLIDLESRNMRKMELRTNIRARWACHPSMPDFLLGFGNTRLHIFSWSKLMELDSEARTYFPPRLSRASTLSHAETLHGRGSSARQHHETLGRLLMPTRGSAYILLQLWTRNASNQFRAEYLLFNINDICEETTGKNVGTRTLDYITLPPEVAACVLEPLSFLSRSRLMFLNPDHWVCTWRLPSAGPREHAMGTPSGENSDKHVERYYFLPGDWVKGDEIHLCCVMADGTLLCPRNGDVASVQCAQLRK